MGYQLVRIQNVIYEFFSEKLIIFFVFVHKNIKFDNDYKCKIKCLVQNIYQLKISTRK